MARGYRKLGWLSSQRKSILRNMATDLFVHEKIETTLTRAKELQRYSEKLVTLGKNGDVASRRRAIAKMRTLATKVENEETVQIDAVKKLFSEIAPRYKERNGGYTRIIKLGNRQGDNAPMAIIELV